jgi:hypothetical protein
MRVQPKLDARDKAQETLSIAQEKLRKVEALVAGMQAKLKLVTDEMQAKVDESNRMEADAKGTADRLDLAHRLMRGLKDEGVRWEENVKQLELKAITLVLIFKFFVIVISISIYLILIVTFYIGCIFLPTRLVMFCCQRRSCRTPVLSTRNSV